MPDYSKSKIYKIESLSTGLIYIGSTCQTLSQRLTDHKKHLKCFKNGKKNYITVFKVLECDDCAIYLIEDYPCDRKETLLKREGEWIRKIDCVNKHIPGRTKKQYYLDNSDKIKKYKVQYYLKNYDKVNKNAKQIAIKNFDKLRSKNNCDCGGKYTHASKSTHLKSIRHQLFLDQPLPNCTKAQN